MNQSFNESQSNEFCISVLFRNISHDASEEAQSLRLEAQNQMGLQNTGPEDAEDPFDGRFFW